MDFGIPFLMLILKNGIASPNQKWHISK